jgi:hypothetical protein
MPVPSVLQYVILHCSESPTEGRLGLHCPSALIGALPLSLTTNRAPFNLQKQQQAQTPSRMPLTLTIPFSTRSSSWRKVAKEDRTKSEAGCRVAQYNPAAASPGQQDSPRLWMRVSWKPAGAAHAGKSSSAVQGPDLHHQAMQQQHCAMALHSKLAE